MGSMATPACTRGGGGEGGGGKSKILELVVLMVLKLAKR